MIHAKLREKLHILAKILPVQGDLEKEKDVKALLDATIKHFGKLDILVNNAGIAGKGTIKNTSLEDFDKVMNINVRAVFYLTSLAVPYLTETKGCVVNVSSLTGLRSVSWFSVSDEIFYEFAVFLLGPTLV
ncbi:PREDICTED: 2-(R)-hydroxypropyl-CoM dehydrogenase-like [Acropora digitifera]|uniref:2-(R)-hydroxypropyl-CoM dehydrogenase-like n=1 Tax=Acropora digitifera TaxID=70779 RepID=UPI00077A503B|nr:PREDICTED: 2-(R)-hydroxypropyl-CoM dehydrogenase-like [Acropora digitifera]